MRTCHALQRLLVREGDLKVFEFYCASGTSQPLPGDISGCCGEVKNLPEYPVVRYGEEEFEIRKGMPVRIRKCERPPQCDCRQDLQPALF